MKQPRPASQQRTIPSRSRSHPIVLPLVFGWGWAAFLVAAPWLPDDFALLSLIGNGPVAGAYLGLFYWVREMPRERIAGGAIVAFGTTHLIWLLIAGWILLGREIDLWGETYHDFPIAILITGVGFAVALGCASWSLFPVVLMVGTSMAAAGVSYTFAQASNLLALFFGCAVLHALMASAMAWDTHRFFARLPPVPCNHCGYSLTGLPSGVPCPECGSERHR